MYLSLVKQTDSALQGLIDYFSQAEEDTMIVFFGDHMFPVCGSYLHGVIRIPVCSVRCIYALP